MQDDFVPGGARSGNGGTDLKALLEAYERSLIVEALAASGGHQRRTAARLGVLPTTLHEKMKRLGLLRRPGTESSSVAPPAASRVAYPASAAEGRV
jgi:DNA-binding NtrC family response regulator